MSYGCERQEVVNDTESVTEWPWLAISRVWQLKSDHLAGGIWDANSCLPLRHSLLVVKYQFSPLADTCGWNLRKVSSEVEFMKIYSDIAMEVRLNLLRFKWGGIYWDLLWSRRGTVEFPQLVIGAILYLPRGSKRVLKVIKPYTNCHYIR